MDEYLERRILPLLVELIGEVPDNRRRDYGRHVGHGGGAAAAEKLRLEIPPPLPTLDRIRAPLPHLLLLESEHRGSESRQIEREGAPGLIRRVERRGEIEETEKTRT